MYELIAVGFQGTYRASEVIGRVQSLHDRWALSVRDAVAIYRTENGKLHLDQSVQPTSHEGAAWGGLLGGMLGAILAAPFTAGASAAAAAAAVGTGTLAFGVPGAAIGAEDAAEWKDVYGIPEDFVTQVGGMVQPGQSAILLLAEAADPELVAKEFRGYGGTVLRTTLSPAAAARIQSTLRAQTV